VAELRGGIDNTMVDVDYSSAQGGLEGLEGLANVGFIGWVTTGGSREAFVGRRSDYQPRAG